MDATTKYDKAKWGPGAWQHEPDRLEWKHAGLPCLIVRPEHGALCGYAAVPPGHPLHGTDYGEVDASVDVHGGLTYSDRCSGHICHVTAPGEPDDVWWFGFDCAHSGDVTPGWSWTSAGVYRTIEYVRAEVERLAEQLGALGADQAGGGE